MTNIKEIKKYQLQIIKLINQSIELQEMGIKVEKIEQQLIIPTELQNKFNANATLDKAFHKLTLGRQRAYIIFFDAAKQTKTREDRIVKYMPRILAGKGYNDCICGLSKKMPQCDGSHKILK